MGSRVLLEKSGLVMMIWWMQLAVVIRTRNAVGYVVYVGNLVARVLWLELVYSCEHSTSMIA